MSHSLSGFSSLASFAATGKDTGGLFSVQHEEKDFLDVKSWPTLASSLRPGIGPLGEMTDLRRKFRVLVRPEDPLFHGASLQDAMFPFRPEQTSVGCGHGGELQPLRFCNEIRPGTVIENEVGDFGECFVDRIGAQTVEVRRVRVVAGYAPRDAGRSWVLEQMVMKANQGENEVARVHVVWEALPGAQQYQDAESGSRLWRVSDRESARKTISFLLFGSTAKLARGDRDAREDCSVALVSGPC